METQNAILALAALAQESRLAIFRLLVQAGSDGLAASRISEALALPASSLSFHLKEMCHADLLSARPDGRFIIYATNFSTMNSLIAFLTENCCGGQSCGVPCGLDSSQCAPNTNFDEQLEKGSRREQ